MPRKEIKAVPESNGPVPQQKFGSGQPTLEDVYRMMKQVFKLWDRKMDKLLRECKEEWRSIDQRLARLEHDARQPRLATEADGPADTKTERTESAAKAVQAKYGDSGSAQRVQDGLKNLPLSLVGKTFWSRTALRRPSRVSYPWRCAHHQPLVAYFPPAKPL